MMREHLLATLITFIMISLPVSRAAADKPLNARACSPGDKGVTGELNLLTEAALRLACTAGSGNHLAAALKRSPVFNGSDVDIANIGYAGWRLDMDVCGGRLKAERLGLPGKLRHAAVQYDAMGGERPTLLVIADGRCEIRTAQRLHYGAVGRAERLEDLDADLRSTGSQLALNPPVPPGVDPIGIPVAIIDTGVNYLLPDINMRLARDDEGRLLGYDYWDMDRRPFDIHPVGSPFFPRHHGTQTASLLLKEAPIAKIVPYRYPGSAMDRMPLLIGDAAVHGIRLLNISLVSRDRTAWQPFFKAANRHDEMLFIVAAGNDGRNIERQGIYPAGLPLDNVIVVTSAGGDGDLADDANWGP